MTDTSTVLDTFRAHAAQRGDRMVLGWFNSDAREVARWSVRELHDRSQALAGRLLEQGCRPGETVLLIYPPGLDFFEAFLACMLAGLIPASFYPPNPMEGERLGSLGTLCQQLDIRFALTNVLYNRARHLGNLRNLLRRPDRWPSLRWLTTDALKGGSPPPVRHARPDDLAFVQFTSGSTSTPRGVRITFANIKHQLDLNREPGRIDDDTRAVMWLPQYHDFGLFASFLGLYACIPVWFCSPLDFLKRPACWPEMMHRVGATHTGSPNFGYALVTRKTTAKQRSQWDLSRMRCCNWGAEVIRPETVRAFQDAFSASGLPQASHLSGWGLAEHCAAAALAPTEIHSFDDMALQEQGVLLPVAPGAPRAVELSNAGGLLDAVTLRIVDADGRPLPEGHVGEVWLQSEGVAAGYACDDEATRRVFQATLADEPGHWLRTGDLGALLGDRLYITGRLKELIIVRGRNLYPTDVEASARAAHPAIRPGGVAAVALGGADSEALGVVVEVKDAKSWRGRHAEICAAIHAALTRDGYPLHTLAIVEAGVIPKTTSGKLRRATCAQWLAAADLDRQKGVLHVQRWPDAGTTSTDTIAATLRTALAALPGLAEGARKAAVREALERCLSDLLGTDEALPADATLVEMGLDSLKIAALAGLLEEATGVAPDPVEFANLDRLDPLAAWLVKAVCDGPAAAAAPVPVGEATEPTRAPATSFQRMLLRDHGNAPAWFGVLEVEGPLGLHEVEDSLALLVERHDLLRSRFVADGDGLGIERIEAPLPIRVLEIVPPGPGEEASLDALRTAVFQPFDLSAPPLLRVGLVRVSDTRCLVAIAVHHLVYDAISIQELMLRWIRLLGRDTEHEPSPSFLAVAHELAAQPVSDEVRSWWREHLRGARWPMPVPVDVALETHHMVSAGSFQLDRENTLRLAEVARRGGATLNTLACLGWALAMAATLRTDEVVTGCAVSTRPARHQKVIGPLVDDVLLRIRLPGDQPAEVLLRGLGDQMRQAAARVEIGFDGMVACVRELGTYASRSASPCPVLYSFHDWDGLTSQVSAQILQRGAWLRSGPLRLRALPVDRRASDRPYDYFALVELRDGCLGAALRVQDARVGAETGHAIVDRWRAALSALSHVSSTTIRQLLDHLDDPQTDLAHPSPPETKQ